MVRVPGQGVEDADPDGGPRAARVRSLWMSRTEIPWEVYDQWILGLDPEHAPAGLDGLSRPSKPYISMDRGFGHQGHPAISMSARGAREFVVWLSAATGKRFRLPTEAEWEHACRAGRAEAPTGEALDREAWHAGNSGARTRPVGSAAANAFGLCDMLGNAAEWCVAEGGGLVVRGGSWRDPPDKVGFAARAVPARAWNASDPQSPKSVWWLADAPFVGLRVVCDEDPGPSPAPAGTGEPRAGAGAR